MATCYCPSIGVNIVKEFRCRGSSSGAVARPQFCLILSNPFKDGSEPSTQVGFRLPAQFLSGLPVVGPVEGDVTLPFLI